MCQELEETVCCDISSVYDWLSTISVSTYYDGVADDGESNKKKQNKGNRKLR